MIEQMIEQMVETFSAYLFVAFKFFIFVVLGLLVCGASFLIGSALVRLVCCVNERLAKKVYDIKNDNDVWR